MALVRAPAAPYPPSQAVFARAKLSTTQFDARATPVTETQTHKLTAMPHCTAFYSTDNYQGPHNGAMCVSACGTQMNANCEPLGVICDPVLDGNGVYRHPEQLGSLACGVRGMYTIAIDDNDLADAAIGDNLYISAVGPQPDVANSMTGYKLLRYETKPSIDPTTSRRICMERIAVSRLVGRIVGFGHNHVIVVLA